MNTSMLRITLVAAAISLSLSAPAASAQDGSRETGVGEVIAAQGNAALRTIRGEFKFSMYLVRPALPVHPRAVERIADSRPRPRNAKVPA